MGLGNKSYAISSSTGGTPFLAAGARESVTLRSIGPDRVYLAFNEAATNLLGMYMDAGDVLILDNPKASAAIYGVCAATKTADMAAQITL